jgi:hypothetical protein
MHILLAIKQRVVQFTNMAPFANFNIVIAPEAFAQTDPAIALNAYRLFRSTIPAGYSISQNVECVKYKIVSNRACSIILTSNGKVPSIYIQIASYVNKKMFIFTMQGTHNDFNNYLPMFRNMLTSFKASATSLNTKTAPTVNSTTIQKTPNKVTTPITPKTSMLNVLYHSHHTNSKSNNPTICRRGGNSPRHWELAIKKQ